MYQEIELIGNVGRDPDFRLTPSGTPVASFTVATNRVFTDKNGNQNKETTWFRITCWNDLAKYASDHIQKGDLVFIKGRLDSDPNTGGPILHTKSNGKKSSQFEITVNTIKKLTKFEVQENENEER